MDARAIGEFLKDYYAPYVNPQRVAAARRWEKLTGLAPFSVLGLGRVGLSQRDRRRVKRIRRLLPENLQSLVYHANPLIALMDTP